MRRLRQNFIAMWVYDIVLAPCRMLLLLRMRIISSHTAPEGRRTAIKPPCRIYFLLIEHARYIEFDAEATHARCRVTDAAFRACAIARHIARSAAKDDG